MTKKRKGPGAAQSIGGMLAGFDQQIFRTTPPVQELVAKGQPVRAVSGDDGSGFEVVFPDDRADLLPSPSVPVEPTE